MNLVENLGLGFLPSDHLIILCSPNLKLTDIDAFSSHRGGALFEEVSLS